MAVTGQQVFNIACTLMDEVSENGAIVLDNPDYYKTKAISILTILQSDILNTNGTVNSLDDPLMVDDNVALKILPYGLAAHLLLQDDLNSAAFYNAKYDELKSQIPKAAVKITDSYNVLNGMS